MDDDPDERVAEIRANVGGEILDTRVNFLPVNGKPWKQINRAAILLDINIIRGGGMENAERTCEGVGVDNELVLRDCWYSGMTGVCEVTRVHEMAGVCEVTGIREVTGVCGVAGRGELVLGGAASLNLQLSTSPVVPG